MEELCRFSYVDISTNILFSYLLDKNPDFLCQEPTLRTVLVRLDQAIDAKLASDAHFQAISLQFPPQRPVSRSQLSSSVRSPAFQPPPDSPFLRVRLMIESKGI
jgi:hypothetical protein